MKHITFIVIVLFSVFGTAQQIKPIEQKKNYISLVDNNSYYLKDINGVLDKFLGTWKYEQGNEIFEITFTKEENIRSSSKWFEDELVAHYRYIKDNIVIFDTHQEDFEENGYFISGSWFDNPNNVNQVEVFYSEPNFELRDGLVSVVLTYNPPVQLGQTPTLTFSRQNLRFPVRKNDEWTFNPYEVPNDLTLIRQ